MCVPRGNTPAYILLCWQSRRKINNANRWIFLVDFVKVCIESQTVDFWIWNIQSKGVKFDCQAFHRNNSRPEDTPFTIFREASKYFSSSEKKGRIFKWSSPPNCFSPLAQETIDKLLNLADRGNWIWKDGKSRPPSPKRRRSPSPNEYIPVYNMGQGSRLPPQFPIKRSRTDSLIELSDNESIRSTKSSTKSYRNFEHEKGVFLRAAPKDKIIDAEDAHAYQVKSEFLSSALGSSLSLCFMLNITFQLRKIYIDSGSRKNAILWKKKAGQRQPTCTI